MKNNKEEEIIIKEASGLAASRYISQAILAIRGFIIAKVLGPSLYGMWNIVMTTTSLAESLDLGSGQALMREIPYNNGRGLEKKNKELISSSFWWQFLITAICSLVLLIVSLTPLSNNFGTEILLLSIVLLLQNSFSFIKIIYMGRKKIHKLSLVEFGYAILNTTAGLSLLFSLKIKGLLLGMVITYAILLLIGRKRLQQEISLKINWQAVKRLVKIGFPILIIGFSTKLMENIDKIVIFFILGSQNTGYYGLAAFISLIIMYIPQVISNVLYPRMNQKYGRTKKKSSIQEYYSRPMALLTHLMPVFLGLIILNTDWILKLFLPEYEPAARTIQILTAGLFFVTTTKIPTDILIVFNKQKKVMKINLIILAIGLIIDLALVQFGIEAVAIGTASTFFILSSTINFFAMKEFKYQKKLLVHIKLFMPLLYSAIILLASVFLVKNMSSAFLSGMLSSVIFAVLSLPIVYLIHKQENILFLVKKIVRERFK